MENSHATTALSWADGIAKAYRLRGERDRHVVAVIGDGALTGGMAWEAINNIAADKDLPLTIVVNDNERSYAPTTGGLAQHLATLRTTRGYERFLSWGKQTLRPHPGRRPRDVRHAARREEGPEGHRRPAGHVRGPRPEVRRPGRRPRHRGRRARAAPGPRLRRPGAGARDHPEGPRLRAGAAPTRATASTPSGSIDPETGEAAGHRRASAGPTSSRTSWCAIARERPDVVGVTAAMCIPVGLDRFAAALPGPGLRRRHRRAARDDQRGRAWPSPGCTRSSRSTPRSSTARSTRC